MFDLTTLQSQLIVSCQAYPGEPLRDPRTMAQMAQAAVIGGAAAVRIQGIQDLEQTRVAVDVPMIGLWKDGADGVFITPTLEHALACAAAGSDIVAIDGTRRPRPDGRSLGETIAALHEQTGALVMADCGSAADALRGHGPGPAGRARSAVRTGTRCRTSARVRPGVAEHPVGRGNIEGDPARPG